jgi:hypothetical protein
MSDLWGGGYQTDAPSGTTFNTQFGREAPQIEARRLALMDEASKYASQTPQTIPTQQVAAFDPMQTQAFDMAQTGIGKFAPYLQAAGNYVTQSTQQYDPTGQTAGQTGYQQYMNPYQSHVIGGIEDQFAKLQNQAAARGVQTGAFGGAREGIQTAELGAQQARAVGQAQASNYLQAQQAARGDFENQMARYAAAGQASAGLGQQMQGQIQQDVASSMAAGSVQQQRAQQISDASYRQQIQQAAEPYQRLGFVSDIYSKVPSTQMATTMGTSPMTNPLAQALGGGIMGLGMYQGYQNAVGG